MITTDDKRSEYPSELADLRQIPLADVPALSDRMVRRFVAESVSGKLPVAAFNSAI